MEKRLCYFQMEGEEIPFQVTRYNESYIMLDYLYPGCEGMTADFFREQPMGFDEESLRLYQSIMLEISRGIVALKKQQDKIQQYEALFSHHPFPMRKGVEHFLQHDLNQYTPDYWSQTLIEQVSIFLTNFYENSKEESSQAP